MEKTRVLYIIASADIGGAENFIYALLKSMDNSKYEKYVVCPSGKYYSKKFGSSARKTLFINERRSFMNVHTILKVARFIRENKIDIVHTMLYTSDFCGIAAALISGHPAILNTINGFNFLVLENRGLRLRRRIASLLYRFIYRYSDRMIAVAEAVREDLIRRAGISVMPGKIETILAAGISGSYDYSEDDARAMKEVYLPESGVAISAIGTLEEVKDYDTMLKAFSIVKDTISSARLLIAGDGPQRSYLENRKKELGLDGKVHFLGPLEHRKINALLSITDVFVMTSRSEGCPTALLEAMYFGKPAVVTRVGGIPEVLYDGNTGILVNPGDVNGIAAGLLNLANDKIRARDMGLRTRQRFIEHFSEERMLADYGRVYEELLHILEKSHRQILRIPPTKTP